MATVKSIGLTSALKVGFVVYALLGLIAGVFCTVVFLAGVPFGPHIHVPRFLGLFALVLCPIFYGIIGSIVAVLSAFLYNLASRWTGGLEVDIG